MGFDIIYWGNILEDKNSIKYGIVEQSNFTILKLNLTPFIDNFEYI